MDFRPFSLRALYQMYQGRRFEEWIHTAALLSVIANSRMGVKRNQMVSPQKLHPYIKETPRPKRRLTREESRQRLRAAAGIQTRQLRKASHGKRKVTESRQGDD